MPGTSSRWDGCEPRRRRLTRHGDEQLIESSPRQPNGAIILWHPARDTKEYFLVERRRVGGGQRSYDGSFPGDGALVWRITPGTPIRPHISSSPDLALGSNSVWQAGTQTPPLTWSDGSSPGVRLSFNAGFGGILRVSWP